MKIIKSLSYACLPLMMLLLAACSGIGVTAGSGKTGNESSLSVLQVLQNSSNTMKNVKTAHIEMKANGNVQRTGGDNKTPSNISFNIAAKGDEALPDQTSLNVMLVGDNSSNQSVNVVLQSDKVYLQNPAGKWYVMDRSKLNGSITAITTPNMSTLINVAESANIKDHGDENVNGQNLRHITATLDKNGLQQLLANDQDLRTQLGQSNVDTLLKSTKTFNSSVDLWIDETKFYVHRSVVNLDLKADTSAAKAYITPTPNSPAVAVPSSVSAKISTTVDLSNFDGPVTITPPTNATPTDNPMNIFMQ